MNGVETDENAPDIEIDDSLEDRLKVHGISKRNVRSIIHEIFSDENVLKLLTGTDCTPGLDLPEAPLTRSRKQRADAGDFEIPELPNVLDDLESSLAYPPYDDESNSQLPEDCNNTTINSDIVDINTESCFDGNGEFDWQAWLSEFDPDKREEPREVDEDSESDPDYNFLAEIEEPDAEDYRDDRLTRISKRELVDLTKNKKGKNKRKFTEVSTETCIPVTGEKILKIHPQKNITDTIDDFLKCKTMKEKLKMLKRRPVLREIPLPARKKKAVKPRYLTFSQTQKEQLRQQMQQHVQLLTQTCILDWKQSENFETAAATLHDIEYLKAESCTPNFSYFNVATLPQVAKILNSIESSPSPNTSLESKGLTLAHSKVFIYRELLPKTLCQNSQRTKKRYFTYHEDCLVAHGLSEMCGYHTNPLELTSQLLLPVRTKDEIVSRIRTAMRGNTRKGIPNPIVQYRRFGILPSPCTDIVLVKAETAISPIQMEDVIPDWLRVLRPQPAMNPKPKILVSKKREDSKQKEKTRKFSARNLKRTDSGDVASFWTKEIDAKILSVCKQYNGPSKEALFLLTRILPMRTSKQIENRFNQLLKIYSKMSSKTG